MKFAQRVTELLGQEAQNDPGSMNLKKITFPEWFSLSLFNSGVMISYKCKD